MIHISAQQVKQLRDRTGARVMDCKQALVESNGDFERAIAWLRQNDLIRARKLDNGEPHQGLIESYIHLDKRIGVLLEMNCQTDFVARSQPFQDLAKGLAMQIAAFPIEYIGLEEIPAEVVEQQRALERVKPDLAEKPESLREQIVEGRVAKRLQEMTLLEQSYLLEPTATVRELCDRTSAAVGEKIQLKRFARFVLGQ